MNRESSSGGGGMRDVVALQCVCVCVCGMCEVAGSTRVKLLAHSPLVLRLPAVALTLALQLLPPLHSISNVPHTAMISNVNNHVTRDTL